MKTRNWKLVVTRVLGIAITDLAFAPFYSGEDFERACTIAERLRSAVWEDDRTRGLWIVADEQPPYALKKPDAPRDPAWVLMGDARAACQS